MCGAGVVCVEQGWEFRKWGRLEVPLFRRHPRNDDESGNVLCIQNSIHQVVSYDCYDSDIL